LPFVTVQIDKTVTWHRDCAVVLRSPGYDHSTAYAVSRHPGIRPWRAEPGKPKRRREK
jgi:hypothetical protein